MDIFSDGDTTTEDLRQNPPPTQKDQDQQEKCTNIGCTLPKGHKGVHSYEDLGTWKEGARRNRKQAQLMAEEAHDSSYF